MVALDPRHVVHEIMHRCRAAQSSSEALRSENETEDGAVLSRFAAVCKRRARVSVGETVDETAGGRPGMTDGDPEGVIPDEERSGVREALNIIGSVDPAVRPAIGVM